MDLFDLFVKIKVDDQASSGISGVSSAAKSMSEGLKIAAKTATAAIGTISAAAVKLYADYEQLVGGVETLFGKSSETVMRYADNAYKTAGMTANKYMETVTSFSASLIQSLTSRTSKASDLSSEKVSEVLDRQYDEQEKLYSKQEEALSDSIEEQIEIIKKGNDEQLEAVKKAQEQEVSAFKKATEEKLALINQQYEENLKLIDEEKYNQLKAIDDEIDSLKGLTESDKKEAKKREQEAKIAELEKKKTNAVSVRFRKAAEEELSEYLAEIRQEELEEQRELQIKELEDQKDSIEEQTKAKKEALKLQRDAEINTINETSAARLAEIKEEQEKETKYLKEQQEIQLKDYKKTKKAELETFKELNEEKLSELKSYYDRQKQLAEEAVGSTSSVGSASEKELALAAEKADLAITDMADNANKMGTDMTLIQNAYQGFAKQNYTMLDNLKLGYGGTKTEMQRLLSDAEKIKAEGGEIVEYSIDSFADIVDAIHVIQTEMGITGTTAAEASSTITGSLLSAKAALVNLLIGVASGNQDLSALADNFIDSVGVAADNLVPRIKTAVNGIGTLVKKLASDLAEAAPKLIDDFAGGIEKNLPTIINSGLSIITSLANGIAKSIPNLISTATSAVSTIVDTLSDPETGKEKLKDLGTAGYSIIKNLAKGIGDALPNLLMTASKLITTFTTDVLTVDNIEKLVSAGKDIFGALISGATSGTDNQQRSFSYVAGYFVGGIVKTVVDGVGAIFDWFGDLWNALWEGFTTGNFDLAFDNFKKGVEDFNRGFEDAVVPNSGRYSDYEYKVGSGVDHTPELTEAAFSNSPLFNPGNITNVKDMNLNINVAGSSSSAEEIAEVTSEALERFMENKKAVYG